MNIYLRQRMDVESTKLGTLKGIAYSGSPIPQHGPWSNLIVDISTLSIAKEKTPILRDHIPSQVAGHGSVTLSDNQVHIDGKISRKNNVGMEIVTLAEDGFEWEMSLGVYEGDMREVVNEVINGFEIEHGWVIENGVLREVSVVALGADMNTTAEIFNSKKGEKHMQLTKEQWIKFACACGGHKDSTPEEMETKFKDTALATEEQQAKIDDLQSEIDSLKSEIAAKQAEIDAIKSAEELEERESTIEAALTAKNIEMSKEKISKAAASQVATETLLSLIEDMPSQSKKIDEKFSKKETVSDPDKKTKENSEEALRMKANALVSEGKAKDFMEAINMVEVR